VAVASFGSGRQQRSHPLPQAIRNKIDMHSDSLPPKIDENKGAAQLILKRSVKPLKTSASSNPVDLGWIAVRTARLGRNSWIGLILPVGRPWRRTAA
jgi:hypothetical protein